MRFSFVNETFGVIRFIPEYLIGIHITGQGDTFPLLGSVLDVTIRVMEVSVTSTGTLTKGGISTEDAINMIVNGFCKEVFKELPMEFAVEATKLLALSLEGSVG